MFKWIPFYEEIADKLLVYHDKKKRLDLLSYVNQIATEFNLSYLLNKNLKDICPFTVLGTFNRHIKESTRKKIAKKWAKFLGVKEPIPNSFEGVPLLNNQLSWFFTNSENQQKEINNLWDFYVVALNFSNADENYQDQFKQQFDNVMAQPFCSWQLTNGLFWIRPNAYLVLDKITKIYLADDLGLIKNKNLSKNYFKGDDYLQLLDDLSVRFKEDYFYVHSFPELYLTALRKYVNYLSEDDLSSKNQWQIITLQFIKELCQKNGTDIFTQQELLNNYLKQFENEFPNNNSIFESLSNTLQRLRDKNNLLFLNKGTYQLLNNNFQYDDDIDNDEVNQQSIVKQSYNLVDLIKEGCFVDEQLISKMISSLNRRKNIILQGPPGTGKTWLAKRLANIIVGYKNSNNIKSIQFHPGMSYEDFIRGYRPSSEGKLVLIDGPFLEMVNKARNDSQSNYVIVIEEINRGNPAQILGEMLTLLEADKRTPSEALELTYRREHENGIFIPNNLYVIGTMNLADRSLAMVDFALRRRFAFFNLSPNFDEGWLNYMIEKTKLSRQTLEKIKNALNDLNQYVTDERMLGSAFTIGHSYLTHDNVIPDALSWYTDIIDSEIKPLLEEYWFDDKNKLETALNKLVLNDL